MKDQENLKRLLETASYALSAFLVLPNFHLCFCNLEKETWKTFSISFKYNLDFLNVIFISYN